MADNQPIVTSGEESDVENRPEDEEKTRELPMDDLYDDHADEGDERYVNEYLRQMTTPRQSDAILSCPLCMNTVCMDCQRHERYHDQYRAMFVMNIVVRWDCQLVYDNDKKGLIEQSSFPVHHVPDREDEVYYQVCCANCLTQVAALDAKEEVYHFYGCMASS